MAKIRVLRILEYIGEGEIVWNTLRKGGVPANGEYSTKTLMIKSALVGFPDLILENNETSEPLIQN